MVIRALCLTLLITTPAIADFTDNVARLNHAGFSKRHHCTAALVEGGHVVTAAHCVPEVDEIVLLFGYDLEDYTRVLRAPVEAFHVNRDRDLAIWCNADPAAEGLSMAAEAPGADARFVGYGTPYKYKRQITPCPLLDQDETRFLLDCPATHGASGGTVLSGPADTPVFHGTVSATGNGRTIAVRVGTAEITAICGS